MLERSLMTKRYAVPAFSLVTFLPCMVSPIVKPGPTVPLTVFAAAAWPPPAAASAAAATAARSTERVRVVVLMSLPPFGDELGARAREWIRPMLEGRDGCSHRGGPPDFSISRRGARPCRPCGAPGERQARPGSGAMLWLRWKTLSGSYRRLT